MQQDAFDFELLMKLAKDDPEHFERTRQNYIEQLINSAPEHMHRRLRGIQFQVDQKRSLHSSPLGACLEISKMMYESLERLNQVLHLGNEQQHSEFDAAPSAKVLAFRA